MDDLLQYSYVTQSGVTEDLIFAGHGYVYNTALGVFILILHEI
jgi:hypothetical protein